MAMNLLLASTSPRRRELLGLLGVAFQVIAPTSQEILTPHLLPMEQTQQFAKEKAESVSGEYPNDFVLGSDTVIEIEGTLLGKPENMEEAQQMLFRLRGKAHQVHTGVSFRQNAEKITIGFVDTAIVWLKSFNNQTLRSYLDTEESLGKAGAYSIQGEGAELIEKIEGDYTTVVGLPLWKVAKVLEQQGLPLPNPVEEIYRTKPYRNWKDLVEK